MKALANAFFMTAVVLAPLAALGQTTDTPSLTRAQVRDQLLALEKAGYNPATSTSQTYPADLKAAEKRVAGLPLTGKPAALPVNPDPGTLSVIDGDVLAQSTHDFSK
ncbi:DUF4148 domain-containing protein [Caballeronia sp. HLA56]